VPRTTCPAPAAWKELLEGSLPEDEQGELSAHLEGCAACQQALQNQVASDGSWAGLARRLAGAPPEVSPALRQALSALTGQGPAVETQAEAPPAAELPLDFLDPPTEPGQLGRLGPYAVEDVLGRGGMGVVLRAYDPLLQRRVAIKVMAPQLAATASARQRFLREARSAAKINHEHVVTIHSVDEFKGLPFLVMQYVAGGSLEQRLDFGPPPDLPELLRVGKETALGLAAAHEKGLVHRDVKPANILLEEGTGRVKLTDFGLARGLDDASVSQAGVIAGTPLFMAPEQARGEPLDHRADLFSLGSVLYTLCTGRPPFGPGAPLAVLRRVADEAPPAPEVGPRCPPWLAAVITRLHAREPGQRFGSAAEVAEVLGRHLAQLHAETPLPVVQPEEIAVAEPVAEVTPEPLAPRRRGAGKGLLACAAVLAIGLTAAVAVAGAWFWLSLWRGPAGSKQFHGVAGGRHATGNFTPPAGGGPPAVEPVVDTAPTIPAPKLPGGKVEVMLPEPYADLRTGGGGRYLVFLLKKAKKLAVFDVSQVKIVHEIELPTEDVLFACGRDKLMLLLPGQRLVQRWSLRTFQREQTEAVPNDAPVKLVRMGCASDGPLALWAGGDVLFYDVQCMEQLKVKGKTLGGGYAGRFELRASADGKTFVGWTPGITGQQYGVLRLNDGKMTAQVSPDGHSFNGHWALPAADGSLLFRFGPGVYDRDLRPLAPDGFKGATLLPAEDPRFFLAVREQDKDHDRVSICANADRRVLFTVPDVGRMTRSSLNSGWGHFNGEPRARYLPSANVLVILPDSNDRVVVHPFNLMQALDDSGQQYLFVLSEPRTLAAAGKEYVYAIDARSKAGGVRFTLEKGPEGMKLPPDTGTLRWQVPAAAAGKAFDVIVTLGDSAGKEITHAFTVRVE
jgi:tRNA A-37 threonylcarbamoyl transferase component Bud32